MTDLLLCGCLAVIFLGLFFSLDFQLLLNWLSDLNSLYGWHVFFYIGTWILSSFTPNFGLFFTQSYRMASEDTSHVDYFYCAFMMLFGCFEAREPQLSHLSTFAVKNKDNFSLGHFPMRLHSLALVCPKKSLFTHQILRRMEQLLDPIDSRSIR